ncbi:MAG TPA: SRPBCC domain-containing protein [Opitutaceae bacterium]
MVTRLIRASASRIFQAWTNPQQLALWLGPGECEVVSAEIDLRPGGQYRIYFRQDVKTSSVWGVYREIVVPHRLVFSWINDADTPGGSAESIVTVLFSERNGVTEVTVKQSGFTTSSIRDDHFAGWTMALENLERLARTLSTAAT